MLEKLTDAMIEHEKLGNTQKLIDANIEWAKWAIEHCVKERLDLALEISKAISNYIAYDEEKDE